MAKNPKKKSPTPPKRVVMITKESPAFKELKAEVQQLEQKFSDLSVKAPDSYVEASVSPLVVSESWNLPFKLAKAIDCIAYASQTEGDYRSKLLKMAQFYLDREVQQIEA